MDGRGAEGEEERHHSRSEKMWKMAKNVNQPPQLEVNKAADVTSSVNIDIFRSEKNPAVTPATMNSGRLYQLSQMKTGKVCTNVLDPEDLCVSQLLHANEKPTAAPRCGVSNRNK